VSAVARLINFLVLVEFAAAGARLIPLVCLAVGALSTDELLSPQVTASREFFLASNVLILAPDSVLVRSGLTSDFSGNLDCRNQNST